MEAHSRGSSGSEVVLAGFTGLTGFDGAKPDAAPALVFGLVSDSHLRTDMDGRGLGTPDRYLRAARELFRDQGVDAVVHCGDMADRGQIAEMEFHAAIWNEVFPGDLAPDGRKVERLFVLGNHDIEGFRYGLGCPFRVDVPFPDPEETTRHLLAANLAAEWERVWGEKYEPAWHRTVKGHHFFGLHWGEDEALLARAIEDFSAAKNAEERKENNSANPAEKTHPFFVIAHDRPERPERFCATSGDGVGFFGHTHCTASNWNQIFMEDGWPFPWVQVPSCSIYGDMLFGADEWISQVPIEGAGNAKKGYQCLVARVYDNRIAIERHEISEGGSLGPDWTLPVGKGPVEKLKVEKLKGEEALREALKKSEGIPQFRAGAELKVNFLATKNTEEHKGFANSASFADEKNTGNSVENECLRIEIPLADGNPPSRPYAYSVEVAGGNTVGPLRKAVYASGVQMGAGHEPDGGATALEIPVSELPAGNRLRISVRPLSSLGINGQEISTTFTI